MDPNVALRAVRTALSDLDNDPSDLDTLEDLINSFNELDTWLQRGGFLPAEWQRS